MDSPRQEEIHDTEAENFMTDYEAYMRMRHEALFEEENVSNNVNDSSKHKIF